MLGARRRWSWLFAFLGPAAVAGLLLWSEQAGGGPAWMSVRILLVVSAGLVGLVVARALTSRLRSAHDDLLRESRRRGTAEDELVRRDAFLTTLIDVLGVEVVAVDPQGRSLLWNEASRLAYGVADPENAGDPGQWSQRFSLLDADGSPLTTRRLPLNRALAGDSVDAAEVTVAAAGQPPRHLIVHARPIRLPDGELLGAVTAGHDVTVLRSREAELQRLISDLDAIARAKDVVLHGSDISTAICEAALEITGALSTLLLEVSPDGGRLVMTRCAGAQLPGIDLPVTSGSLAALALRSGRIQFAADVRSQPEINQQVVAMFDEVTGGPHLQSAVHVPLLHEGRARGVLTVALPTRIGAGDVRLFALLELLAADTVQGMAREDLLERLATQALTDPLTGLLNRRAWDAELGRQAARSGRSGSPLAVAVLDLDHFKSYNDLHGHPAGDSLLRDVSRTWEARLRSGEVLARLGGEEFAVLLPDCGPLEAADVVSRLLADLPGGVTCSAGVALLEPGCPDLGSVMGDADRALYQAKQQGRARSVVAGRVTAPAQRTA